MPILEASSTTILPNFVVDELTLYNTGYYTLHTLPTTGNPYWASADSYGPVIKNGFFEILPTDCDTTPHGTGFMPAHAPIGYGDTKGNNSIGMLINKNQNIISNSDILMNTTSGSRTIQVYPNPTQNNITIIYPCNSSDQLEISIKDMAGRMMYSQSVSCSEGGNVQQVVDMSAFEQGVYFVELALNDQCVVKKIVKL